MADSEAHLSLVRHVGKPERWDEPFGRRRISDADVKRVLACPHFRDINPDDFPDDMPLAEIIANDGRIIRCKSGQIIMRRGDYGGSLFVILKGAVRGLKNKEDEDKVLERRPLRRISWWRALTQLWRSHALPEVRTKGIRALQGGAGEAAVDKALGEGNVHLQDNDDDTGAATYAPSAITLVEDVDATIKGFRTFQMSQGEMFGEIAALARSPRTATIFATEEGTELLELRWQGVRDIRQWSDSFHDHIDGIYKENGLAVRLRDSELFDLVVGDDDLGRIADTASYETHGDFAWTHRFKQDTEDGQQTEQVIEHEPLIIEQGHYLDGLLLINSGFARVSEEFDHGEKTVDYLARDDFFGLEEIIATLDGKGDLRARRSLRAIGYVDVIRVPTHMIEKYLLPKIEEAGGLTHPYRWHADPAKRAASHKESDAPQALLDFLVDRRFINGTKAMAINTDRCINCDDCVRACASTHENNPRFIRHGYAYQNLMIANACMHCVDPVCLIGCPTGAIHREIQSGSVVIDDTICVGCATCANSCPYNNIRMAEIRDATGAFLTDEEGKQLYKATKCDLCSSQAAGPACERACPHDALKRIDIRDTATLSDWLEPVR